MPLYDQVELLCQAILAQGRQEADRIVSEARDRADRLVADAEARGREEVRRATEDMRAQALFAARNLVDRAALESKRRVAEAKEALLDGIFQLGANRLQDFRDSPDYTGWLRRMLLKAWQELGGEHLHLAAHPEEARWLTETFLEEVGRETGATLKFTLDAGMTTGGFIAIREDGRMRLDLTFQGILSRRREQLRTEIARRLWGA